MAWLSRKKNEQLAVAEPAAEVVKTPVGTPVATGPKLGVLIPDSAGISSFRFTLQDDVAGAEAQIGALTANVRRGAHAFWAMHQRPAVDDSMHVEAMVLIRAKPDSDIVYVVSYLDIESALSFTRFELKRGLHIRNVMIYWAAFTQVREELEGVSIIPAVAPPTVADVPLTPPDPRLAPSGQPAPQASVAVAEPEPGTASSVESGARAAVERYLRANPEKAVPVPSAEAPAVEQPIAVAESSSASEEPAVVEDEAQVEESLWPPARPVNAPVIADEPAAVEQAAVEEALVLQHPPVAEPVAQPEAAAGENPEIVAEPVESAPGDRETETEWE
jgi:hypothetical protein